jgi:hypothetical protein
MHDYNTGLDLKHFQVTADFEVDGVKPGAPRRQVQGGELRRLADEAGDGHAVAGQDRQGNVTRIERTVSVGRNACLQKPSAD